MFSRYLNSKREICKRLIFQLKKNYKYVSILGKEIKGDSIRVATRFTRIGDTFEAQCGFVVRVYNNKSYSEYAFSDINDNNYDYIYNEIVKKTKLSENLLNDQVNANIVKEEEIKEDFVRHLADKKLSNEEIINKFNIIKTNAHNYSDKIINVILGLEHYEVSSMFLSDKKELTQNFHWVLGIVSITSRDKENIKNVYNCYAHNSIVKCLKELEKNLNDLCETSIKLLDSTLIEPGVYDIITAPAITGLIAHEAFGHGVELDMFLKNRAKAKNYINKYVASPLITMHDGASSCLSQASYFFDDDGVLAHDTIIIEKGILKRGISDLVSAMELKMEPTGNGRRQNPFHKSYSRMTNTFFEAGTDNLKDMIKSVDYGYMLCQMDNGMEDPKNWNIQCTCAYAKEIKKGKFTGKIVAPVVMSGNVLDLLQSITAVSKEFEIHGSGHCGKGHKEWVPVSDGGPYLKARCKLG
ncbi:MAG: TldD/PmbA family protein [bacterium]|nr:TldD/PmbA family protein [bacterium]